MYSINDRWNNRNRAKRNESPNFVTATVPIQGMRDNNGNAITSNTVEENVSVPSQSIAPSEVQPAIPTTDTDMPDPSEYHQFQDLYSQLYENPITPEEEEKRKRAASAVEGIGHLGNVMNAFSNLIFTGKGAPSQQLPEVPDEIQKFEDRMAEKRRMYASGLMGAKARDLQDWKDAYTMSYNQKKAIDDRAMELMKLNANMTSQQAKLQAQQDIAAKRAEETKRHNQAMESIGWTNAQTARSNKNSSSGGTSGKRGKDYGKKRIEGPNGETRYYDMNDDNDVVNLYKEANNWRLVTGKAKNVNQMRDELIIKTGDWRVDKKGEFIDSSKLGRKENLGWGKQSGTNKTDW